MTAVSWTVLAVAAPVLPILARITLLLLLALVAVRLLRRASAGTRHVVWLVALAGALATPSASRWSLPILPALSTAGDIAEVASEPVQAPDRGRASGSRSGEADPGRPIRPLSGRTIRS